MFQWIESAKSSAHDATGLSAPQGAVSLARSPPQSLGPTTHL